jgi:acetate---CoA ligase (ADP-forming)
MIRRDPVSALLDPRSVAVVGASADPRKRGNQTIRRLLDVGFPHPIYPVNPTEQRILGLRSYPSVDAIDGPVDLAFIVTPAPTVPAVIEDCGRNGVAAAVVVAVGFGETGEEGRKLEQEVAETARRHGVGLIGPNTNGVFNLHARLNLVGTSGVPKGSLALVCQSGNVGLSLVAQVTNDTELGFSVYAGIGNEAGVRYDELLAWLRDDPHTGAILVYAEGFRDGRRFLQTVREVTRHKPVVVYKAGRSESARRSAMSHTGAIAGAHAVATAALRQAGAIVVDRTDELVPVCETVLQQPPLSRPRIAILADGGGHATVAADALDGLALRLPELRPRTRERLAAILPPVASTRNPVDVAGATDGDPRIFDATMEIILDDEGIDGVLCVGLLGGYGIRFSGDLVEAEERAAERMAELAAAAAKPLVVQSTYVYARPWAHQLLRRAGVPVHESIETAVRCVAALAERAEATAHEAQRSSFVIQPRLAGDAVTMLTEPEGRRLLADAGVSFTPWEVVHSPEEAGAAAARLGGRIALKIVSPDIVHKSDVGGVRTGLSGEDSTRAACAAMLDAVRETRPDAAIEGVLLAPMAPSGVELIVGVTTDPVCGPALTLGAGGRTVEIHRDVTFRAIPVTPREASDMLDELRVSAVLDGYRGSDAVDRLALVELLLAVSRLVAENPAVIELDLNPVIAHQCGADPVDVRVVVRPTVGQPTVAAVPAP